MYQFHLLIKLVNSLDPDQTRRSVRPDLGLNFLPRLSALVDKELKHARIVRCFTAFLWLAKENQKKKTLTLFHLVILIFRSCRILQASYQFLGNAFNGLQIKTGTYIKVSTKQNLQDSKQESATW